MGTHDRVAITHRSIHLPILTSFPSIRFTDVGHQSARDHSQHQSMALPSLQLYGLKKCEFRSGPTTMPNKVITVAVDCKYLLVLE